MSATRLLETARAAGLSLVVEGGNLVIEADDDPPPELITELRQHKAELIAALSRSSVSPEHPGTERVSETADSLRWHDLYAERTGHWFHGGRRWHEAEALAWGELEDRWNLGHGEQVHPEICAGCRLPIGTAEALDLGDGNRVHLADDFDCLRRHGERWRGAATRALVGTGLRPPAKAMCPDLTIGGGHETVAPTGRRIPRCGDYVRHCPTGRRYRGSTESRIASGGLLRKRRCKSRNQKNK